MALITERYADKIAGVLGCFDRLIVTGTLPTLCYADGMTKYLSARCIRIFDFVGFAKPLTEAIKANAEALAAAAGLSIDYIRKKNFRKEDKIKAVLKERGEKPGLVWIFSALEPCTTYQAWHDKATGRTFLRYDDGKCLHYYFYFLDEELGLCYVRVPTWCPFRLQFYCNGHNWLARHWSGAKSPIRCWTTPLWRSGIGPAHSISPMTGSPSGCTTDWMSSRGATVRFFPPLRRPITGVWIQPSTLPTSCLIARRICKDCMGS